MKARHFRVALSLLFTSTEIAAQEQQDPADDWLVSFTLSVAAAQYGGGCQAGDVQQCQIFAELWEYGQIYATFAQDCAASVDAYSSPCLQRSTWGADILANVGPVQGLADILATAENSTVPTITDSWIEDERCLSEHNQNEPNCRRRQIFLDTLRE